MDTVGRCCLDVPLFTDIGEVEFVRKSSTMVAHWIAISVGVLEFDLTVLLVD